MVGYNFGGISFEDVFGAFRVCTGEVSVSGVFGVG